MKTFYFWRSVVCMVAASATLAGLPVLGQIAVDNDQDGIADSIETTGAGLPWGGFTYPPCAAGTTIVDRYKCLSPTSKDIFVYLVTPTSTGGFLATNGFITTSPLPVNATKCTSTDSKSCTGLFGFITAPKFTGPNQLKGTVDGLGVGVHVAVVTTAPTDRSVGLLGQQAVVMTVDESASAFAFGATVVGTPSNTGRSTIWPVYIKNFLTNNVTGGVDTPIIWKPHVQNTASHELNHAAALAASYNQRLGQYHYASGSGTVMDDKVICSSKTKTCNIYNDFATGDNPCLLALVSPTTNPLQCTGLTIIQ